MKCANPECERAEGHGGLHVASPDAARVREIGITPQEDERRANNVAILEALLAEAREGRGFEQVMLVATFPDSTQVRYAFSRGMSVTDTLGKLEYLKFQLLAATNQDD
jgi:hypothetical protein